MIILRYTFITFLIASLFFVVFDISQRTQLARLANLNQKMNLEPVVQVVADVVKESVVEKNEEVAFIEQFKKESLQISKMQNDSPLVKGKIKDLAHMMTPKDSDLLYNIISNEKNSGVQRALAMEVLSAKNDTSSLIALQNFVASGTSVNGTKWNRRNELETVLRAQAVESIASYPQKDIALSTLNYLKNKVDARFLVDRIGRATAKIKKQGLPTTETESVEEATLEKLVE